jgi:hypothetical protein
MTARPQGLDPLLQIERDVTCGIRLEFEGRRLKPKFICQVCSPRRRCQAPFERAGHPGSPEAAPTIKMAPVRGPFL